MALTDTEIRRSKPAAKAYKLFDGGGLHLLVNIFGHRHGSTLRVQIMKMRGGYSPVRGAPFRFARLPSSITKGNRVLTVRLTQGLRSICQTRNW